MEFVTKDSGARQEYNSGMRRDLQDGKPRFDLITPLSCSKDSNLLWQWAALLERGMTKYGYRNWELANSEEELIRFKASLYRHFIQFINDYDTEENHAAAICYNLQAYIWLREKLEKNNNK